MQLSTLNPDVFVIAVIAVTAVYGVIWGAAGVRILILSAVAASLAVQQILPMVHLSAPVWMVALGLFALVLVLFMLTTERPHRHGRPLVALVSGALAGAVVVASASSVLPDGNQISGNSLLLTEAASFRWQIMAAGLLLGVMVPLLYRKPHRSHH